MCRSRAIVRVSELSETHVMRKMSRSQNKSLRIIGLRGTMSMTFTNIPIETDADRTGPYSNTDTWTRTRTQGQKDTRTHGQGFKDPWTRGHSRIRFYFLSMKDRRSRCATTARLQKRHLLMLCWCC